MSILSTHGIKPPGGCHFPLVGWSELARMIHPMIKRDFYGKQFSESITPPALRSVRYTSAEQNEIAIEFDQPVVWQESLIRDFYLDDEAGKVNSGSVKENVLLLKLNQSGKAARLTYLKERDWNEDRLLLGTNGLAALTFCDVTIGRSDD
jgi:hypothetical protein